MRLLRCCLLIACCGVSTLVFGQKEDWLPVTKQDQKIKEVPGNLGASAIQERYAGRAGFSRKFRPATNSRS